MKIAPNLEIGPGAVTDTFAAIGTRGSGKTYLAGKLVELLLDNGFQVVVVDPVGIWGRGLRLASDGKGRGFDLPVFGGWDGDVPIDPAGARVVAELAADRAMSMVVNISELTLGQQHKFVTAFAADLFERKKRRRSPVQIVWEEAHEFIPQVVQGNEAEMVGAVKRLWKIGRNFGIGCTLISQRPAEVNKGCLNLTEHMFCGRLKGSQDRKAVEGWAKDQDQDPAALGKLASLCAGELLYWPAAGSPAVVKCYPKRTYDVSRTPDGSEAAEPLPPIPMDDIRKALSAAAAEQAANDPKALRARIADLEKQVAQGSPRLFDEVARRDAAVGELQREIAQVREIERSHADQLALYRDLFARIQNLAASGMGAEAAAALPEPRQDAPELPPPRHIAPRAPALPRASRAATAPSGAGAKMEKRCRRVLTVLAQLGGVVSRRKTAAVAGYPPGGSSMGNALADARREGWVEDVGDGFRITPAGKAALGDWTPLPTGKELREYWLQELPEARARAVFAVLLAAGGKPVARAHIAAGAGYPEGGSSMGNALAILRSREIVDDHPDGSISVARELY